MWWKSNSRAWGCCATPLSETDLFHPLIRRWFSERVGEPSEVQRRAWETVSRGRNALISAPTGSGKTFMAFLWALDRLIAGAWPAGRTRVLYVSPLKALNNDIQKNLAAPLEELREYFAREGEPFPGIAVMTRSGDTPQIDRGRMARRPPEILITTPESLNILVSSPRARAMLTELRTVILDEIHAIAGSKRGVHLMTAVERLTLLSGDFQRIALSATAKPLERVAEFAGGCELVSPPDGCRKRPVDIIRSKRKKIHEIAIQFMKEERDESGEATIYPAIVRSVKEIVRRNRSTLIFVNNRQLCERLAMMINHDEPAPLVYSHHGSLSRETRIAVEERLKNGELAGIVATGSLELGIDIGALDEVVLVQTPMTVSAAIQRAGRAGHALDRPSRATVFPTHARDLIDAAVMGRCVREGDLEPIRPVEGALDVLAQTLTAMAGVDTWDVDELYSFIRTAHPYRNLSRSQFDLVIEMLAGRYGETRPRHLRAMVSYDRAGGTISAKPGALGRVYMAGGTIPDRGYYALRHMETRARIGELDEEFVWERKIGNVFNFGTQLWKIRQITHNDVLAVPTTQTADSAAFWRADDLGRDFHFAGRVSSFLESANEKLGDKQFAGELMDQYALDGPSARALVEFLTKQREQTGADLPHRHHLLIEHTRFSAGLSGRQAVLHTLWGGAVNYPFALLIKAAWKQMHPGVLETFATNDGVALIMPGEASVRDLIAEAARCQVETALRGELEASGYFGARFRENAARSLILARESFNRRTPLWVTRERSKQLLDVVSRFDNFPVVLETWRTCLRDCFDLTALRTLLDGINGGEIQVTEVATPFPSAFNANLQWFQTNKYMYADDTPVSGSQSKMDGNLFRELIRDPRIRPTVPPETVEAFRRKAQRVHPGYAPASETDLLDWVKDRLWIPMDEWDELLAAAERDRGANPRDWLDTLKTKLTRMETGDSGAAGAVAREEIPRLLRVLEPSKETVRVYPLTGRRAIPLKRFDSSAAAPGDNETAGGRRANWLSQWLRYYGPMTREAVREKLGWDESLLNMALDSLVDDGRATEGNLTRGLETAEICDSENLEILLRIARKAAGAAVQPRPLDELPLFLAHRQGLSRRGTELEDLQDRLDALMGYAAPAELWERDILPARMGHYSPVWLDTLMRESGLAWLGMGKGRIAFLMDDQFGILREVDKPSGDGDGEGNRSNPESRDDLPAEQALPDPAAKYPFFRMVENAGRTTAEVSAALWEWVWQGRVVNDTFSALRKGAENRFRADPVSEIRAPSRRAGFGRWKSTRPFAGNWRRMPEPEEPEDPVAELEILKERARILLERYGVLFREPTLREAPAFRWGRVFKALRVMELGGEVAAGYFFEGAPGPQFMFANRVAAWSESLPMDAVYWMNAADPASPCGLPGEFGFEGLPERRATNHVVYHGKKPVLISRNGGKRLEIHVSAEDENLPAYFGLFADWLDRAFMPARSIAVETINGEPAAESPFAAPLRHRFDAVSDMRKLVLRKKYRG